MTEGRHEFHELARIRGRESEPLNTGDRRNEEDFIRAQILRGAL